MIWLVPGILILILEDIYGRRLQLILDRELELYLPASDSPGCVDEARGEVSLDPLSKKGIRYLNLQRIALTTEPKMYPFSKPESELELSELFGHRSS